MGKEVPMTVERLHRVNAEGSLKAFCDVAVAGAFLIKGIKVVEGKKGLFVSMPRERGTNGQWYGTVIPLSKEVHQRLSEQVLKAYQDEG